MIDKPRVFITGATGFLGSHLACQLLKKGYTVLALRRKSSSCQLFEQVHSHYQLPNSYKPQWEIGDLLDIDDLLMTIQQVDVVFHCAGMVSFNKKDRFALLQNNVIGSRNVVNACIQNGIKKIVHASSIATMGRPNNNNEITEKSKWVESKYNSQYALSKYLAEQELWRAEEEGVQVTMVNPGIILGLGDGKSGSNLIYKTIHKGMPFYPTGSTGFVGVEDVAKMMILLFEQNLWGDRFLCVSENMDYQKLFNQLADAMGKKLPTIALGSIKLKAVILFAECCAFLRIPFSLSSETLLSSSKKSLCRSENCHKIKDFAFAPIRAVNYYALSTLGLLKKELSNQNN